MATRPSRFRATCASPRCGRPPTCPDCHTCPDHCTCPAPADDPPRPTPDPARHARYRVTLPTGTYHATRTTLHHLRDLSPGRTYHDEDGPHTYTLGRTPQDHTVVVHQHARGLTLHGREDALDELARLDHPVFTPTQAVRFLHALAQPDPRPVHPATDACLHAGNAERFLRLQGGRARLERLARHQAITLPRVTRPPAPLEDEPLHGLTSLLGMRVTWT